MRALGVAAVALVLATPAFAGGSPAAGKVVFKAKCGTCHTFAAAGTKARGDSPGPTLNHLRVTSAKLIKVLYGSSAGIMPSFAGVLSQKQMNDVIAFVVSASK